MEKMTTHQTNEGGTWPSVLGVTIFPAGENVTFEHLRRDRSLTAEGVMCEPTVSSLNGRRLCRVWKIVVPSRQK